MLRALTLTLLLCLAAAAPARAAVPRDWLGVAVDGPVIEAGPEYAAEWSLMAGSGVSTVRVAFYWTQGQRLAPGPVDFAVYDETVLAAAREDIAVLPVVFAAPRWARSDPDDAASPPRDPADYASFLTALVGRYGPQGSLWAEHPELAPRPIRAWQMWNEPNLSGYWSQQPFAKRYVALIKAARRALKAADPGSRAILAGLPNGWAALGAIYRAGGRNAFDVAAIHPYTARPKSVPRFLRAARRVMRRHGDRRKALWVTEVSWPAAKGKVRDPIGIATTERGQARRLALGLTALARARRSLRVARVYWYTWMSAESDESVFSWSGLRRLRSDGSVVSARSLKAFRRTARRLRR
jgi:hypothetical protein